MRPTQKLAEALGLAGCYFLSIVYLAEQLTGKPIDALRAFDEALRESAARPDAYLDDPAEILGQMAGGAWTVSKEAPDYQAKPGELEVLRFERDTGISHFVAGDGSGRVAFDPYGDSRTVREGVLASKRIFRRQA
jgi:hypothetical protein